MKCGIIVGFSFLMLLSSCRKQWKCVCESGFIKDKAIDDEYYSLRNEEAVLFCEEHENEINALILLAEQVDDSILINSRFGDISIFKGKNVDCDLEGEY